MQTQKSPNDPHIRIRACGCKFHHYTYYFCSVSYYISPTIVGWCIAMLRFFFTIIIMSPRTQSGDVLLFYVSFSLLWLFLCFSFFLHFGHFHGNSSHFEKINPIQHNFTWHMIFLQGFITFDQGINYGSQAKFGKHIVFTPFLIIKSPYYYYYYGS
jgi:hypothetical protein